MIGRDQPTFRARRLPWSSSLSGTVTLGALTLTAAFSAFRPSLLSMVTSMLRACAVRLDAELLSSAAISLTSSGALHACHESEVQQWPCVNRALNLFHLRLSRNEGQDVRCTNLDICFSRALLRLICLWRLRAWRWRARRFRSAFVSLPRFSRFLM